MALWVTCVLPCLVADAREVLDCTLEVKLRRVAVARFEAQERSVISLYWSAIVAGTVHFALERRLYAKFQSVVVHYHRGGLLPR